MSSAVGQAPPVSVVCRGRGWRAVQALLYAAAAASVTAWALQWAGIFDATWLLVAAALVGGSAAYLAGSLLRCEPATLRWDGQKWMLGSDPLVPLVPLVPITPSVMLDVAGTLLLRVSGPPGHARWLAATRRDAGASWHALRVAAYARPRAAA